MDVIPAIDLLGGQCVRLYQGDFGKVSVYDQDPRVLAQRYRAAGLDRLHVVDLDGAKTGNPLNTPIITALATEVGVAVQAGGGIRDIGRVRALLGAGADRVVIGSVAAEQPSVARQWLQEVGAERMVLAFDVRLPPTGDPVVVTRGWVHDSGVTLWGLVEAYLDSGARHFLCTDVARDGTLAGPNMALYAECTRRHPAARFIASGGVSSRDDLYALRDTGVAAVVTGKALLDGRLTLEEIATFSQDA